MRTLLRGGGVIAFDGTRHVHLRRGDVVFCGDRIEYAGPSWTDRADAPVHQIIDTSGKLVMPGFVNMHLHVTDTAFTRGWLDDYGASEAGGAASNVTALYRLLPAIRAAAMAEDQLAAAECAFSELLLSGSTTVVELGFDAEMGDQGDMATPRAVGDAAGRLGLRCYLAPRYRSRYWKLGADGAPAYFAYEGDGMPRMRECVALLRDIDATHEGRLRAMLAPGQVDTCEPDLLRATRQAADETGYPVQLHAGQSPSEFRRIRQQYGCTTLEYLDRVGLLGPDLVLGHSMFFSESGDVDACNAAELARRLAAHPAVARVRTADQGPTAENYRRIRREGAGAGALITLELRGDMRPVYDRLAVGKGPSFGLRYTLAAPFLWLAHFEEVTTEEGRAGIRAAGLDPDLLRISVGLEPAEEIWSAFVDALPK